MSNAASSFTTGFLLNSMAGSDANSEVSTNPIIRYVTVPGEGGPTVIVSGFRLHPDSDHRPT